MICRDTRMAVHTPRKYHILAELGCGGMGRVYLAVHQGMAGFSKLVVLKVLRSDLLHVPNLRSVFLREARISARMNHPNVVAVNEVEQWDDTPVIVMEYLQGQPFSAILRRMTGKANIDVLLRILSESMHGLHYAHELKDFDGAPLRLVHRDFTPHNIFVTYDGSVKVLDFGIAQVNASPEHSHVGGIRGKLRYMAPEQILCAPLDRRVDVFAAGVLLSEVISGRRFWGKLEDAAIARRMACGDIPKPWADRAAFPAELQKLCATALQVDRENRYPTVAELRAALDAFLAKRSSHVTTQEFGQQLALWFHKERRASQRIIETHLSSAGRQSWTGSSVATLMAATPSQTPPPTSCSRPEPSEPIHLSQTSTGRSRWASARKLGWVIAALSLAAAATRLFPSDRAALGPVAHSQVGTEPAPSSQPAQAGVPGPAVPATAAAKIGLVRIAASPTSATILIDGSPVDRNPFQTEAEEDGTWHRVRVTAPGHEPEERRVQFTGNVEIGFALIRDITSLPLVMADPESTRNPKMGTSDAPQRTAPGRVRRSRPGSEPISCSPPYTYDANGVKHFEPRCF